MWSVVTSLKKHRCFAICCTWAGGPHRQLLGCTIRSIIFPSLLSSSNFRIQILWRQSSLRLPARLDICCAGWSKILLSNRKARVSAGSQRIRCDESKEPKRPRFGGKPKKCGKHKNAVFECISNLLSHHLIIQVLTVL